MKVERQGVRITDVPGVKHIDVAHDGTTRITFAGVESMIWGPAPLGVFIEALKAAHTEALHMTGQSAPAAFPRVFKQGDLIPVDVTRVRDDDGDVWVCNANGRWDETTGTYSNYLNAELLRYAPLTEVLP